MGAISPNFVLQGKILRRIAFVKKSTFYLLTGHKIMAQNCWLFAKNPPCPIWAPKTASHLVFPKKSE